jgi:hypothetical protein
VKIGSTWQVAEATSAGDPYDEPLGAFQCKSLHYSMITPFSHRKLSADLLSGAPRGLPTRTSLDRSATHLVLIALEVTCRVAGGG